MISLQTQETLRGYNESFLKLRSRICRVFALLQSMLISSQTLNPFQLNLEKTFELSCQTLKLKSCCG